MADRTAPLLHRDNPSKDPLVGNVKVTREDWLNISLDRLIQDGVEGVKIKVLALDLGVSRSSFYWYFKSRNDLLEALLAHWHATNTAALIDMAERPCASITEAVCNVFRCVVNPRLFDTQLDFAIRDWARRDAEVKRILRQSEDKRLSALQKMFERFDFPELEAVARARILYYMQIGYDDAQLDEPMESRNRLVPAYILGFTGQHPTEAEADALRNHLKDVWSS